ncbi:MAG: hypothetical protein ACXWUG_18115, partial [Polyangiales bacterium]
MDRRRFGIDLLGLGTLALGCSAPPRLREIDAGEDTGTDAAPTCPPGARGLLDGDTLKDASITGYRSATGPFAPISTCDYWDPDGAKGIRAFLLVLSAPWCTPCAGYVDWLHGVAPELLSRGTRILEVLISGNTSMLPATQQNADAWVKKYGVVWDLGIAVGTELVYGEGAIPFSYFVDPRTLQIVGHFQGFDPSMSDGDKVRGQV